MIRRNLYRLAIGIACLAGVVFLYGLAIFLFGALVELVAGMGVSTLEAIVFVVALALALIVSWMIGWFGDTVAEWWPLGKDRKKDE